MQATSFFSDALAVVVKIIIFKKKIKKKLLSKTFCCEIKSI